MYTDREKIELLLGALDRAALSKEERKAKENQNVGPYNFLKSDYYVRDIVAVLNLDNSLAKLKNFLFDEIFGVVDTSTASKASYADLLSYVTEDNPKKYKFDLENLSDYFDQESNMFQFKKWCNRVSSGETDSAYSSSIQNIDDLNLSVCKEWIPWNLLDTLREYAWEYLKRFCNANDTRVNWKDYCINCKIAKKQSGEKIGCFTNKCSSCGRVVAYYYYFAQTIALYEIFFQEFVIKTLERYQQVITDKQIEIDQQVESLSDNEAGLRELLKKMIGEKLSNDIMGDMKKIKSQYSDLLKNVELSGTETIYTIYRCMALEFGVDLYALLHILMIIETINSCTVEYYRGGNKSDDDFALSNCAESKETPNKSTHTHEAVSDLYDLELRRKAKVENTIGAYLHDKLGQLNPIEFSLRFNDNPNRRKRYRYINTHLADVLDSYSDKWLDTVLFSQALTELVKPHNLQKEELVRGTKILLAYPLYRELGGETTIECWDKLCQKKEQ